MSRSPVVKAPHCAEAVALRTFGQRVRQARQVAGMSQETAALAIGLHPTYLSDVEQGYRNVSLLTLMRLAQGLGVEPAALVEAGEGMSSQQF